MHHEYNDFPQEIIDNILNDVAIEKPTLKACSLVSKSWVYPSYSHLFHSTKLMGYTAITSFVHLIQSSHPVFTQFIRHLRIEHLDDSGHSNTVIQPQALASILPYLPSLRCLEFVGVGIASNPSKPPFQDEPRFALEHVEFSCCSFGDSSNFFRVLHMFAEITNLRVISPDTGSHVLSSPYADAPNPSPTKLQSFFFRFAPRTAGNFIHILNTATFLQELKLGCLPALDVALPDGPLAVAVSDFVYTLAPNLYAFSLDLRISSLGWPDAQAFLRCGPRLTQLQSLTVSIMLSSPCIGLNSPHILRNKWWYIITLLLSLPETTHATFRRLQISWSTFGRSLATHVLQQDDLEALSNVLDKFHGLESVDFIWELRSHEPRYWQEDMLSDPERFVADALTCSSGEFLPRLRSKGVLHFSIVNVG